MRFPNFLSPFLITNLCVQAVMSVILVRQIAICQQGSKNISRKTKKSHIFRHLNGNHNWKSLNTPDIFQIIDSASLNFKLKLKKAMHITWTKPSWNRQLKHVSISVTV